MSRWVDPVPALKRRVADEILVLVDGWSQTYAAWLMHVSRARVSELRRGNLDNISLERLVQCLSHLDRVIELRTSRALGFTVHDHRKLDANR